jgi:hypothetical protein
VVHFTSSDTTALLPANTHLTSGAGVFSVTLQRSGNQTITATDTAASTITGVSSQIATAPAAASHLGVSAPATAAAGSSLNVTVTALDPYGNIASGYVGAVHFTSTSAGVLPSDYTFAGANVGVGVFSVTLNTSGNQTVTVTDTVTSSITGTSGGVNVQAPATHFTVSAPTSVGAGTTCNVTVRAVDQNGNVSIGYTGTVHLTSSDLAAVLPPDAVLTAGVGTFHVVLNTLGNQTVTATDANNSALSGVSGAIAVVPNTVVVNGNMVTAYEGSGLNGAALANFVYGDNSLPAGNFSASVNWGDGTTSVGTVVAISGGYQINGSHLYNVLGQYAIAVSASTAGQTIGQSQNTVNVYAPLLPDGTRGTANQRLISSLYYDLLGRSVDAGGAAYWTNALSQGVSIAQVVQMLESTTEFRTNEVKSLFTKYLHRNGDSGGVNWAAQFIAAGGTMEQLAAILLSSQEYFDRSGDDNTTFLRNLFQDVLGRAIDSGALAAFSQFMSAGGTRLQIATIILSGTEYRSDFVNAEFHRFLNRDADPGALSVFTQGAAKNWRDEAIVAFIVGQPAGSEYYRRVTT